MITLVLVGVVLLLALGAGMVDLHRRDPPKDERLQAIVCDRCDRIHRPGRSPVIHTRCPTDDPSCTPKPTRP